MDWKVLKNTYIDNGLKIFPIMENKKIPLIDKWNVECSSNLMQVAYWYNNAKNCNWALPCKENNLFVIDLDRHDIDKDGVENFDKLLKDLNIETPIKTLTQTTPSGGIHYIFKSDEDLIQVKGVANAFDKYSGIDLRNRNYIVCQPSKINSNSYVLNNTEYGIQSMPEKLKEFILNNSTVNTNGDKKPYERPSEIVQVGGRDESLFAYISDRYFHTNLEYDELLVLANWFNENILEEPFKERDVEYKVKKAFEKDRGRILHIKLGSDKDNENN